LHGIVHPLSRGRGKEGGEESPLPSFSQTGEKKKHSKIGSRRHGGEEGRGGQRKPPNLHGRSRKKTTRTEATAFSRRGGRKKKKKKTQANLPRVGEPGTRHKKNGREDLPTPAKKGRGKGEKRFPRESSGSNQVGERKEKDPLAGRGGGEKKKKGP